MGKRRDERGKGGGEKLGKGFMNNIRGG